MKENILGHITDLVSDFVYYDRKESESLTMEQLDNAVKTGEITVDEMVDAFRKGLEATFNNNENERDRG